MAKRLLYLAAGLIVLGIISCASALLGCLVGDWGAKQRRFSYEKDAIAPVLAADPAFARLEITMYTGDGSAYLLGEVPTEADLERLRSKMDDILGKARQVGPLDGVSTAEVPPNLSLQRSPATTATSPAIHNSAGDRAR